MEKRKRNIAILFATVIVITVFLACGFGFRRDGMPIPKKLVYGITCDKLGIDPIQANDEHSIDLISQVAETLFDYDYDDPELSIVPLLATSGIWNDNATEFTCTLHQGVKFHDGTDFNAQAVKWNFDRLYSMITEIPHTELYQFSNGLNIVNETVVVNDYIVKFVLNGPYVPFQALLCFTGLSILSPTSTPNNRFINTKTEDLIGTGPFVYYGYEESVEVSLTTNHNYWGDIPQLDGVLFSILPNVKDIYSALLSGDVHLLKSPLPEYFDSIRQDPDVELKYVGPALGIRYLFMNNNQIPVEMRKAISYALDYNCIINEIMDGEAVRMKSPIPKGIIYANLDFNVPTLDLKIARETLIEANWSGTEELPLYDDKSWKDLAETNPIAIFNYTYDIGNPVREKILDILKCNLVKIGIKVECAGMTNEEFMKRVYEEDGFHRDMLQLGFIKSCEPDYNDASSILNPLFTNKTNSYNFAQVNDDLIELWMEEGLSEIDPVRRKVIYDKIQQRLIEKIYPCCWCYVEKNYDAFIYKLKGLKSNAMDNMRFKYIYSIYE